jgi:hypothetical protein
VDGYPIRGSPPKGVTLQYWSGIEAAAGEYIQFEYILNYFANDGGKTREPIFDFGDTVQGEQDTIDPVLPDNPGVVM